MSTREKVYILIAEGKSNKEIAQELNINLRTVQIYKKEYKAKDETKSENKNEKLKRKKEKAKALIITGAGTREVAEETRTSKDTITRLIKSENLYQSQLEYLNNFRNNLIKEIEQNKIDRFLMNKRAKEKISQRINVVEIIDKDTQALIKLNEETEQKILELNRIERLEKLKLEQNSYRYKLVNEFMEKLEKLTDEELADVIEIMKQKEEKRQMIEV